MTEQPEYVCWAGHAEDLSDAVERERQNPGELTVRYLGAGARKSDAATKVVVECSEGHLNTFEA